jgi:hypothetical protein
VMARYRSWPAACAARVRRRSPPAPRPPPPAPRPLRTRVPDLRLDRLGIDGDGARGKLHADGRLRLEVKLVAREPREQIRLADARVADQDHCTRGAGAVSGSAGAILFKSGAKKKRRGKGGPARARETTARPAATNGLPATTSARGRERAGCAGEAGRGPRPTLEEIVVFVVRLGHRWRRASDFFSFPNGHDQKINCAVCQPMRRGRCFVPVIDTYPRA